MTQLSGKVALVTGASSGLGAATARLFAQRGASAFGIARDGARMADVFAEVPGGSFASVDIAEPAACRAAVAQCVAEFGRLDIRVNPRAGHRVQRREGARKRRLPRRDADPQVTDFAAPKDADRNLIMRIAAPRGMMDPLDVARTIAFLASDDAAIHGAVYRVDNGKGAG